MIKLNNISKKYGTKKILNNIHTSFDKGHCYGLLGLNGAGKSTLMKIICNVITNYDGTVEFSDISEKNIGFMLEGPSFYNELTGKQNLEVLSILFSNIKKNRVEDVLKLVGLEKDKNVKYKNYSLGMKQRLYFAYAIINEPKVLILDEPFNGIDPITSHLFKRLIKDFINNDCIVLISSHVINDLKEICDHVIMINDGMIVYDDKINCNDDIESLFVSLVGNSDEQ